MSATLMVVPKGKGFSMAVAATANFGEVTPQTATIAVGYQFNPMFAWEINATSSSIADLTKANPGTAIRMENQNVYSGIGYSYLQSSQVHSAQLRLGAVLGSVDLSLVGSQAFDGSSSARYGMTLRTVF